MFPRDLVAGLTVGVLAIPQSLSYASVAGLLPQFGLYNAFLGLFAYVFLGTSPHLIVGPTAVLSLMTRAAVPTTWGGKAVLPMTIDATDEQYAVLTFLIGFLAGIVQVALGLSRLGFLVSARRGQTDHHWATLLSCRLTSCPSP
jgi:MFS superfamily sulfate permease-like transporter